MRRKSVRCRAELAWALAGIIVGHLALGLVVECLSPAARDPEFTLLEEKLRERRSVEPHRPLVLALGSSRTVMGLQAARLSKTSGGPLVFNFGIPGAGPLTQRVVLERLLEKGYRPNLVLVEVLPSFFSRRAGCPLEERLLDTARLTWPEVAELRPFYERIDKLLWPWIRGRACPTWRHQAELQDELGLALLVKDPADSAKPSRDSHGWQPALIDDTPAERERRTRFALDQYGRSNRDPTLGRHAIRAVRELLERCRELGIEAALVVPPEASVFRDSYVKELLDGVDGLLADLSREFGVPVHDARRWVADDGFWDAHHLLPRGADVFTERLAREALRPASQAVSAAQRRQGTAVLP
jgi:hypothetical protein